MAVVDGGVEVVDDLDPVVARLHGFVVVLAHQLVEVRRGGQHHPVLEVGPVLEVRKLGVVRVAIGPGCLPVGWGDDLGTRVLGLAVEILQSFPTDITSLVGHDVVGRVLLVVGVGEGVVEHGVGHHAARVDDLSSSSGVEIQWLAGRAVNDILGYGIAQELLGVERINVATMVLVEVVEVVVEADGRREFLGNRERDNADISWGCDTAPFEGYVSLLNMPCRHFLGVEVRVRLQGG